MVISHIYSKESPNVESNQWECIIKDTFHNGIWIL